MTLFSMVDEIGIFTGRMANSAAGGLRQPM